jgi:uncharacterized protein (DUF1786 family)
MSSAAEARFRVQAANSKPRAIKVIALDAKAASGFSTAAIDDADLVVMVATPNGHAEAASIIGEACRAKGVVTTALIVRAESASNEALSKTLAQLRPWSLMVVVAEGDDYVDDLLNALRA